jgi:hypothetical protein
MTQQEWFEPLSWNCLRPVSAPCCRSIFHCQRRLRSGSSRSPTAAFWKPNSKVLPTRQRSFITVSIVPVAAVRFLVASVGFAAKAADRQWELLGSPVPKFCRPFSGHSLRAASCPIQTDAFAIELAQSSHSLWLEERALLTTNELLTQFGDGKLQKVDRVSQVEAALDLSVFNTFYHQGKWVAATPDKSTILMSATA